MALATLLHSHGVWATVVWNVTDVVMNRHGWIALGLALSFRFSLMRPESGCGLMVLMFFSSRSGQGGAADPFRKKRVP